MAPLEQEQHSYMWALTFINIHILHIIHMHMYVYENKMS